MTKKKIELTDTTGYTEPTTFEEWVSIHGEPEYLGEVTPSYTKGIIIEDCTEVDEIIDTSEIITEDKQGNPRINYKKFVDVFAKVNNVVYCNGVFYNPDGVVSAQSLRRDIANSLGNAGWTGRIDTPTNAIYQSLKDMYTVDELPVNEKVIPLANGDLHIGKGEWVFRHGEKKHSPYRLSVNYIPVEKPMPLFNKWLNDVFAPEDIPTVQEIMGYCLVPTTAAGEAFFIVGDGEAGKSGLGTILMGLLGNASVSVETQQLVTKQFQIAEVEHKLLAYDDDLGSAALTETGLLKKLITADTPIRAERKYCDPHQFNSYCRILASANFMLSSLYDDSNGFFRRLHPILVKPKAPDRKVINKFYELILEQEREQIFKWALIGLRRVMANGWKITWSERSRTYMKLNKSNAVHFEDFFNETCEVATNEDTTIAEIKKLYSKWCTENGVKEASERRLSTWFADNAEKIGIQRSVHIKRNGKDLRGYVSLKIKPEWKNLTIVL
ncbi:MAG: phage/plasmid primase, P4 family [Paludibacteraceae bacterium]|nr:phage/plasmid primase, P4 family [Paludibacteraceae bacterium]